MKKSWIGLAGVSPNENPKAVRWAQMFEWPMVVLGVWIVLEWYFLVSGRMTDDGGFWTNLVILFFFVIETVTLSFMVKDTKSYLKSNWLNLVIIFGSVPLLFAAANYVAMLRLFRLLVVADILLNTFGGFRRLARMNHLGVTLLICFIVMVVAGVLMAGVDPAITSISDGIWWAWVTVSTVGYGDVVPETIEGKIFASVLIAMGIGMFSMLTASFSAFLMSREEETMVAYERTELKKLLSIEKRMEQLEEKMDRLSDVLVRLEANTQDKPRDIDD